MFSKIISLKSSEADQKKEEAEKSDATQDKDKLKRFKPKSIEDDPKTVGGKIRRACFEVPIFIGIFLGISGDYTMLLWKENFFNRKKLRRRESTVGASTVEFDEPPHIEGQPEADELKRGAEAIHVYNKVLKLESQMSRTPVRLQEIQELKPVYPLDLPEEKMIKAEREFMKATMMIPKRRPYFTWLICCIQSAALAGSLIVGGIAPIGLMPSIVPGKGLTTFRGTEEISRWDLPNPWIGPDIHVFLAAGAILSPCMRNDSISAKLQEEEPFAIYGCCNQRIRKMMGTTTERQCAIISTSSANWTEEPCPSPPPAEFTLFLPCCFGLVGNCKLATEEQCRHLKGTTITNPSLPYCSKAKCLQTVCLEAGRTIDDLRPPSQSWRIFTSIFIHPGILYLGVISIVQWLIGSVVEEAIGPIRMALIYVGSGTVGNVFGAIFNPAIMQMGGGAAAFGMLGVSTMELIQANPRPFRKYFFMIGKLATVAAMMLLLGTFPFVDNFSFIGGLLFALPLSVAVCPHLSFNYWTMSARRIIFSIAITIYVLLLFTALFVFYHISDTMFCQDCAGFSCIPYNKEVCNFPIQLIGSTSPF